MSENNPGFLERRRQIRDRVRAKLSRQGPRGTAEVTDIQDRLESWCNWWRTCLDCGRCHVTVEQVSLWELVDCPACGKKRAARTAPAD